MIYKIQKIKKVISITLIVLLLVNFINLPVFARTFLDKTYPERNIWKLIKYQDSNTNQVVNEHYDIPGNEVLNGGKRFSTGDITEPGTYYTELTVFDESGNGETAHSESIQVTVPSQMLLVHASIEEGNNAFEYDENGEVEVKFNSDIEIRGNTLPVTLIYDWNFGDGGKETKTKTEENSDSLTSPAHIYKEDNSGRVLYHPDLTVTAIWENGYSETWNSKAGTVIIIDKPEFVALSIEPNTQTGSPPLNVLFMVSDMSFVKNSTITSYTFDFGAEGVIAETGEISEVGRQSYEAALDELKSITFQHTYDMVGEYTPNLSVSVKENSMTFQFNAPIISVGGQLAVSSINVQSPVDNYFTNLPVQTFNIDAMYVNPSAGENRLTVHIVGEDGEEIVTELIPDFSEQTLPLAEGINIYWFELINPDGSYEKSLSRKITHDSSEPELELTSPVEGRLYSNGIVALSGVVIEENFEKVTYSIGGAAEVDLPPESLDIFEDEVAFYKEINVSSDSTNVKVFAYDKAGNVTSEEIVLLNNRAFRKVEKERFFDSLGNLILDNDPRVISETVEVVNVGEPFMLQTEIEVKGDLEDFADSVYNIDNLTITLNGVDVSEKFKTNAVLNKSSLDLGKDLDGVAEGAVYLSANFNSPVFDGEIFGIGAEDVSPEKAWKPGVYNFMVSIQGSSPHPGTELFTGGHFINYNYRIVVERNPELTKENEEIPILEIGQASTIKFDLVARDQIPIGADNLPVIGDLELVEKPDTSEVIAPSIGSPQFMGSGNVISTPIEFTFTPDVGTGEKKYKFRIPVVFPSSIPGVPEVEKEVKINLIVNFSEPGIIIDPTNGSILKSDRVFTVVAMNPGSPTETPSKQFVHFNLEFPNGKTFNFSDNAEKSFMGKLNNFDKSLNEFTFKTKLNLDVSKKENLAMLFKNGNAFGRVRMKAQFSNLTSVSDFDGASKEYVLLDNLRFKKTKLISNKDGKKILKASYVNNTKLRVNDSPKLRIKAFNPSGEVSLSDTCREFDFLRRITKCSMAGECREIVKPVMTLKIDCLPDDITKVELDLIRNDEFLKRVETKLKNTSLENVSLVTNQAARVAETKSISLKGLESTSCSFTPPEAGVSEESTFYWSTDKKNIFIGEALLEGDESERIDFATAINLPSNKLFAKNGSQTFTIPEEWSDSTISVTVNAGNESDDCELVVGGAVFEIGDVEDKFKLLDGEEYSVSRLKNILNKLGLLEDIELGLGYTQKTKDAWKIFNYLHGCNNSTFLLQTNGDSPIFNLSCSQSVVLDENGNPVPIPDPSALPEPTSEDLKKVSMWEDSLDGFLQAGLSNIKEIFNPTSIGIIAVVLSLSATGIFASVPAIVFTIGTYSLTAGGSLLNAKLVIDELNTIYNDKSNAWKISYAIGKLGPDFGSLKSVTGFIKNTKISGAAEAIGKIDNGAYDDSADFIHQQQKSINYSNLTEEAKNLKRDQLENFGNSIKETIENAPDLTTKQNINSLFKDLQLDETSRVLLEKNVIYRDYPKDLAETAEDIVNIKNKIYKPVIRQAAKSKAAGVESRFLFETQFIRDVNGNLKDFSNINDLRSQGFLKGDILLENELPSKVWRIVENRSEGFTMLSGNGPLQVFWEEGLNTDIIKNELVNNRNSFLKRLGVDPLNFMGELKLLEIDVQESGKTFWKSTNKDAKFDKYFRYNNNDNFGFTLDLNGSNNGLKEIVTNDIKIEDNIFPSYIKVEELN